MVGAPRDDRPRPRVLLIAPDQQVMDALAPALRERFRVFVARSVSHAVAVADELEWRPDVVIIDFAATTVGTGVRFVRLLRWHRTSYVPVVALHRGPEAARIERAVLVDVMERLPVEPAVLVRRVADLIESADDAG